MNDGEKKFAESVEIFMDAKTVQDKNKFKGGRIVDAFEVDVNAELNKLLQTANDTANKISFRFNNFQKMVWAGSKGKATNLAQVMGMVGQQNIEGSRITMGFNRRTLPHFTKDDHGLEVRIAYLFIVIS